MKTPIVVVVPLMHRIKIVFWESIGAKWMEINIPLSVAQELFIQLSKRLPEAILPPVQRTRAE